MNGFLAPLIARWRWKYLTLMERASERPADPHRVHRKPYCNPHRATTARIVIAVLSIVHVFPELGCFTVFNLLVVGKIVEQYVL